MKDRSSGILTLGASLLLVLSLFLPAGWPEAKTLTVCANCSYDSIQEAIDGAEPGNTVLIKGGTYRENLTIDKDLTLKGAGYREVQIVGTKEGYPVVSVGPSRAEITIEGVTLKGAKGDKCRNEKRGVCPLGLVGVGKSSLIVKGVKVTGNKAGIGLISTYATIKDSRIRGNNTGGIGLGKSARAKLIGNEVVENGWGGISLSDSAEATITENLIAANYKGIKLWKSSSAFLKWNTVRENKVGIQLSGAAEPKVRLEGYGNALCKNEVKFEGVPKKLRSQLTEPFPDQSGGHPFGCHLETSYKKLSRTERQAIRFWERAKRNTGYHHRPPKKAVLKYTKAGNPDRDERNEVLLLYKKRADPLEELRGVIFDPDFPFKLRPLRGDYYLGEGIDPDKTKFLDRDKDQLKEIYIHGGTGAHIHLLNVFKLKEGKFRYFGEIGGDIGVRFEDVIGDKRKELLGMNGPHDYGRASAGPPLLEKVSGYRWQNGELVSLGTWLEPLHWIEHEPPFDYPETAVVNYYYLLNEAVGEDKDLARRAYQAFNKELKKRYSYKDFLEELVNITRVRVKDLKLIKEEGTLATVSVKIEVTFDGGGEFTRRFGKLWTVKKTDGWKLNSSFGCSLDREGSGQEGEQLAETYRKSNSDISQMLDLKESRDWAYLGLPGGRRVKVYLYAPGEVLKGAEGDYCGAPVAGSKVYKGRYLLVLDASTVEPGSSGERRAKLEDSLLDLGRREFVAGTPHEGKIQVEELDPNTDKEFLTVTYYSSCNCESIGVYGYDPDSGSLRGYPFRDKGDDHLQNRVSTRLWGQDKVYKKSKDGNLITGCYNNSTCRTEMSEWKFVPAKKEFQEVRHWQED